MKYLCRYNTDIAYTKIYLRVYKNCSPCSKRVYLVNQKYAMVD
jgi:hypothetical protein